MRKKTTKFIRLKEIYEILHGPRGCMWDKKQTHKTLIPDLKEEVGEFISAVKKNNYAHMEEELGDILLYVMFNAQIASKNNKFDIEDVIDGLIKKIKRRHPHVFGNKKVKSTREIIANWNKIKSMERK
ncbi:MAG: nucleotide pyrophosphohydrolase [Candidatus Omnitrophica bacterium]|nr:nucleotide pyrophosphohydrolase [Candidatus Omnitrophota bacterium]